MYVPGHMANLMLRNPSNITYYITRLHIRSTRPSIILEKPLGKIQHVLIRKLPED